MTPWSVTPSKHKAAWRPLVYRRATCVRRPSSHEPLSPTSSIRWLCHRHWILGAHHIALAELARDHHRVFALGNRAGLCKARSRSAHVGAHLRHLADRKSTRLNSSHVAISYAV